MAVPVPRASVRPRLPIVAGLLFVDLLGFSALIPILPRLRDALGVGEAAIGVLVAAMPLGTALATLPMGRITELVGPRRVTISGAVAVGIAFLAFGTLTVYPWLLGARLLQGVASAALWVAGPAWVALGDPAGRARRLATTTGAGMAGTIVGAGLGGIMADRVGLFSAFVALGVAALVGAAIALVATSRPTGTGPPTTRLLESLSLGFRSVRFRTGAATTLLAAGIGASEAALLALALGDLGYREAELGLWLSIAGVSLVVGQVSGPRVAARIGTAATLVAAGLGASALALTVAIRPTTVPILVMLVGLPLLTGWMYGLSLDLLASGAEEAGTSAAIGISYWNLAWAVGATIGPVAITAVLEAGGISPAVAVVVAAGLAVALVARSGRTGPPLPSRHPRDTQR
ncbi:MAG: MFS transporter [Acidimicrobiia bacterium]